ncbi:hypothetical protein ES703_83970 [subsurface metagenome]
MRQNHKWNDDERDIIRRDYKHTHRSRQELAARLGVTDFAVAGQISTMGIAKSDDRRQWSPEEKERLARMMHRSLNSVVVMSKRINVSRLIREGWYTKREVCEILAHDHKWVQTRIDSGALKATYHYEHRPTQKGMSAWHIDEHDLVLYIRKYPQDLVGCNIDIIMIVELLAGIINNQ